MAMPAEEIARLNSCFVLVADLRKKIQSVPSPESGSSLKKDDNQCHPLSMSSHCHTLLLVAVDHLGALREVMKSTQKMPVYSSHTLIRTALECSSTVINLLSTEDRKERLSARLASYQESHDNLSKTMVELSAFLGDDVGFADYKSEVDEYNANNQTRIKKIIDREKLPSLKKIYGGRDNVFHAAKKVFSNETGSYHAFVWRSASGIAHGKEWATLRLMTRKLIAGSKRSSGVVSYSLGADSAFVVAALECSVKTLTKAYETYMQALTK
jgi:hypothetical protein